MQRTSNNDGELPLSIFSHNYPYIVDKFGQVVEAVVERLYSKNTSKICASEILCLCRLRAFGFGGMCPIDDLGPWRHWCSTMSRCLQGKGPAESAFTLWLLIHDIPDKRTTRSFVELALRNSLEVPAKSKWGKAQNVGINRMSRKWSLRLLSWESLQFRLHFVQFVCSLKGYYRTGLN